MTPEQFVAVMMVSVAVLLWMAFMWGVNRTVGFPFP